MATGSGRMLEGEEERAIGLGDLIYVPPGAVRGLENALRKRCPLASQQRHRAGCGGRLRRQTVAV